MIYYIVGSMLVITTFTDILWRKIPNSIVWGYFILGIFTLHFGFAIRFLVALFLFSILYHLKFFGAGDVKLFSLLIGFLGTYEGMNMTFIAIVLASIGSLIYMLLSGQLFIRFNMVINYCMRVIATGKLERYYEYDRTDKCLIPMVPFFLAGFILWRCFC